ncbi:UDP-N-acetyl-D-mannosamine dehydrogenase [Rhodobacter ferrooxidans]|nr:UDP-N-acetyl-D-mannosamine dehydrogenase [Rhodobacter sp. SW2]
MQHTTFNTISVIGLGYIGLPTAAMFASRRIRVVGVDVNPHTVKTINLGRIHIVEPDLDVAVHAAVQQGFLRATTKPERAEAFLIAVPTPFKGANFDPDLNYVEAAARSIAPVLEKGNLVILESTSPVGATELMAEWLAEERPDLTFPQTHGESSDIRIAHCPERVLPGKVMHELISNDRVIGGMTRSCSELAASLYRVFVEGECAICSSPRLAEMAKLTENSFRDVNIAFANELSVVCDRLGIDVWELIGVANRHPRVNVLQPGPGVGGHCIAVDPWFIVHSAPEEAKLIRSAREVNDAKPAWVVKKILDGIKEYRSLNPEGPQMFITVAFYGLTFKPDIDDLRESPAKRIVESMLSLADNLCVLAVEPNLKSLPDNLAGARLVSMDEAENADLKVLLVAHSVFRTRRPKFGMVLDFAGLWQSPVG